MEFVDAENMVFNEIIDMLEKHSDIHKYELQKKTKLSLPGLKIYPGQRRAYYGTQEIYLTTKEYDLLYLLAVNKGCVLTYEQIYEKIWGNVYSGGERNTIGFHIRNLRRKLDKAFSNAPFTIQCIREVGYCLEMNQK